LSSVGPNEGLLAEAHLAEYSAITVRLSTWITLQYAIYAVAGAAVAALASSSLCDRSRIWIAFILLQLLVWAWLQTACEIFIHVLYIEEELKAKVASLAHNHNFWGYEPYLNKIRGKGFVKIEWTAGLAMGYVILLVGAAWLVWNATRPWGLIDSFWVALIVYLSAMVGFKLHQMEGLQRRMKQIK
jgi:hypothetical protein